MIVGLLRWSRVASAVAAVIFFASACGSDGETSEPPATTAETILTDEPVSDGSVASATEESQVVVDAPAVDVNYTPATVQFDPANPPADEELRNVLFGAVRADHVNGLWCWANTSACVEDVHLGPAVVGPRYDQVVQSLQAYRNENGIYQAGNLDGIFPVEINPSLENEFGDDGFRVVAQVFACEAYNGIYFVPDASGGVAQLLNDAPAGYITEFAVWQGQDGSLRTGNRTFSQEGGLDLCDQYRG